MLDAVQDEPGDSLFAAERPLHGRRQFVRKLLSRLRRIQFSPEPGIRVNDDEPRSVGNDGVSRGSPFLRRGQIDERVRRDAPAKDRLDRARGVDHWGGDDDDRLSRGARDDGLADDGRLRVPRLFEVGAVAELVHLPVEVAPVSFHVDDEIGLDLELRRVQRREKRLLALPVAALHLRVFRRALDERRPRRKVLGERLLDRPGQGPPLVFRKSEDRALGSAQRDVADSSEQQKACDEKRRENSAVNRVHLCSPPYFFSDGMRMCGSSEPALTGDPCRTVS